METADGSPKILIVNGYHPKEIFAVEVGEYLQQSISIPDIQVVSYMGKADRGTSTYHLRKFIEQFDPVISPIILHGDDDMDHDAGIAYSAKSKQEKRVALKPLRDFAFEYFTLHNTPIGFGRFLTYNTKCSLIDIELNSRMGKEKAINLVESFSKYLLILYSEKGIKL